MGYMDEDDPLAYIALGCVFNPWLKKSLEARDVANVAQACEFLEYVLIEGKNDKRIEDLVAIEIGESLPELREKKLLLSHLGPETRRVCSYHITRLPEES
jgi:hypothetical protein